MSKYKELLLTGCFPYSKEQIEKIKKAGFNITFIKNELEKIKFDVSKFEYIVCNGLFLHNSVERFTNLRFVQATSAGLERLPIDYFKKNDIEYCNARDIYSIPIAEWVIMFILNSYKSMMQFYEQKDNKEWIKNRNIKELTNKVVTIIGYGNIGKEIAKRLVPFNVIINVVDINKVDDSLVNESFFIDEIEGVLPISDVVVLSIALTNDTYHLIDKNKLESMKRNSILINIARGSLIDELALIEKIDKFKNVALDVFETEPLAKDSPLWNKTNVLITPHNSFISDMVNERMFKLIYENLRVRCKE
ncbi:NAD(P)-dependent oxidoreductase [Thomasclavelia sp.]|uniref:NAD(P)-dependent oxidoreductase n=1 Tax=Thomasclavelia sp. TaxID=3025757 RepID=UPI0025CECCE0|nr:NAD(P)-dependent oxidoreductase [Thomasclavelia sp.]